MRFMHIYFSVKSQKKMEKIDKNAYLSLKTRKPLKPQI